jgi:hypothetical protein
VTEPRRRSVWPPLLGLLALAAGFFVMLQLKPDGADSYPKHWDARVLTAVRFVEHDRGLAFKHPVAVEFLRPAQFVRHLTGRSRNSDAWGELDDQAAELISVGLVPDTANLGLARNQLSKASVLGFYDFSSQHIVVRGNRLSAAATVTVVHELTHALQDQYFHVGRISADLGAHSSGGQQDGRSDAFQAVVEGDARRVELDYVRSLTPSQRATVTTEEEAVSRSAESATGAVPSVLVASADMPYTLGRAFVDYQRQVAGPQGVAGLFRRWPGSAMEILQPWRYTAGDAPTAVAVPAAPDGADVFDAGSFGAFNWYLLLAERLEPAQALAAADEWAGDGFVAYRTNGQACFRADVRATAGRTLRAALLAWARAVPALHATVRGASSLRVQSCAPGPDGKLAVPERSVTALEYATDRIDVATAFLRSGTRAPAAACEATRLLARLPVRDILRTSPSARTRKIERQVSASCK